MLNSAEHLIYPAQKCQNANNCWHSTFISMINTAYEILRARNLFIYGYFSFLEQHEKSFITPTSHGSNKNNKSTESAP